MCGVSVLSCLYLHNVCLAVRMFICMNVFYLFGLSHECFLTVHSTLRLRVAPGAPRPPRRPPAPRARVRFCHGSPALHGRNPPQHPQLPIELYIYDYIPLLFEYTFHRAKFRRGKRAKRHPQ